jgi:hypothetical protein
MTGFDWPQLYGAKPRPSLPARPAGLAGLQAALYAPERVRGVQLINISLRGLHVERQSPLQRPLVALLQKVLKETQLGQAFFGNVAKPQVRSRDLRWGRCCACCCAQGWTPNRVFWLGRGWVSAPAARGV